MKLQGQTPRPHWALLFLTVLILNSPAAGALDFFYKYRAGDKFRILSTVNQDIFVNRRLSYRAEIVNRIAVEIIGAADGKGRLSTTFQSAEKTVEMGPGARAVESGRFLWSRDYNSEYEQDRLGYMTVGDQYYKPMVRDVPVFPGRDLRIGENWSAPGLEVHDFRDSFGIEKPYLIPFNAYYTYLGERVWNGKSYPAFSVSYRILFEPPRVPGRVYPRRIQGASDQTIYWDTELGQAAAYEEFFRTVLELSDGQTWEYRGRAEAEVIEAPSMNKEEMAQEIAGEIQNIPDVSVRISDEGIVINLENIQFAADSAELRPSERPKLDKIAEILMKYPDRDILVGGHTALAGFQEMREQLSLERARSVAEYLIGKNVRPPDRIVIQGFGAERPLAENNTEAGRQKNRRVEVIILEN